MIKDWYFPKDAHQKSEGVSEVRFKKNLGNVENHLNRKILRNGRVRVKEKV